MALDIVDLRAFYASPLGKAAQRFLAQTVARRWPDCAGATVLGVSPDAPARHDKFKKKHALALPLVSDEAKAMLEAYGIWKEKSMYGRKYMGVERTTFLIDGKGIVRQIWEKVKVPGHAKAVLEAARALDGAF